MIFEPNKLAVALACALGAGACGAMWAGSAAGQAPSPEPQGSVKVDVTGSNIRAVEGQTSLPVQVLTREDIERTGIQNAAGLVERLSANSTTGGVQIATGEGGTGAGYDAASLRGLGAQRTLVLLNGRRFAPNGFTGSSVDLNAIPLSAIERVEVLTDGASAIYGSDAVAGVINFILRQSYRGAEVTAYYGDSTHGGGYVGHYNAVAGWGDLSRDKVNVFATVDYQHNGGLKASERPFSNTAYRPDIGVDRTSGNSVPANVVTPSGTRSPNNPACSPPFSFPTAPTPLQCRFDFASVIDVLPPQEIWHGVGRATWQFAPEQEAWVQVSYSDSKTLTRVSPAPISQATILSGAAILLPPSSPFYPHAFARENGIDGQPLNIAWRSLALGPRTEQDEAKQTGAVVGAKGTLWGWDYDGAFNWNENKSTANWPTDSGFVRGAIIQPILNSGAINLFAPTLPADQLALLAPSVITEQVINSKSTTQSVDLHASNEIYRLPAGPLAMAVGAQVERDTYEFTAGPSLLSGDVPGSGGSLSNVPSVSRRIYAVFSEFNVPIVKTLEGNVAVRYDHYSDFGSTTNPKASLRWQPTKEMLLRGSWGTGFRAPTLVELYQTPYYSSTGGNYDDPVRCPVTNSSFDCNTQFTTQLGGNRQLKPERSTQYGLGVVWQPLNALTLGVDYWKIDVKDVVGQLGEQTIFNDLVAAEAAGLVVRFPPDAANPSLPGRVNYVLQPNQNIQKLRVEGIDVDVSYRFPRLDWGQLSATMHGTYYINWEQADPTTGQLVNFAGRSVGGVATVIAGPGYPGSLPRWKHNLTLSYDYGPWAATLSQIYQDSYTDNSGDRLVGSYSLWDVGASYRGFKRWTLSAGVKNVFNTNPPASNQEQAFQVGYDPTYSDPRGRFIWGSVKFAFN
jgi:iron complex outermembrane recepter protein